MLRIHGEAQGAARDTEELRRVPAWGGEGEVDSGAGFAGIQSWFETTAELLRKMDSPIRFINASEGGVHIAGFEDRRLRDVLSELSEREITAESIERDARERW